MNRVQLADELSRHGIPTEGQRIYHLLKRAALEGILCYGPERAGKPTWVLLRDWVQIGEPMELETARVELARRYLEAYGPADPDDFARWSGLPVREAREAFASIEDQLLELEFGGAVSWGTRAQQGWLDEPTPAHRQVRFLGSYDPYLLGYRNRDLAVDLAFERRVHPGGGVIRPTLMIDGGIAGIWTRTKTKKGMRIELKPFKTLSDNLVGLIQAEANELGRFLGVETKLVIVD